MSVRLYDPRRAEILGTGRCAAWGDLYLPSENRSCPNNWAKICRGCNRSYCRVHIHPAAHKCPAVDGVVGSYRDFTQDSAAWLIKWGYTYNLKRGWELVDYHPGRQSL